MNNKKLSLIKKICLNLLVFTLLVIPFAGVHALKDAAPPTFEYNVEGEQNVLSTTTGLGNQEPVVVVTYVINWLLGLLGIVALLIILYAGFKWMKARGNDEEVTKAKQTLEAAVIGLVIILSAYGISAYVYTKLIDISNAT